MMNNERRADLGAMAVIVAAAETNVAEAEDAETAITDVLAYVAHFCDRFGLRPEDVFESALHSYDGDMEDGPMVLNRLDPRLPLARQELA